MQGHQVLAKSLQEQGIQYCFGIVGIPVIELGFSMQQYSIHYYGCRNEQGASYAAGAIGYLTQKPGVCLCVSGPGMVHGVAGVVNSYYNSWPMILLAGSSDLNQTGKQAFQETDQQSLLGKYVKFSVKVTHPRQIPYLVGQAVKFSLAGRPGPVYIDVPGDVLTAEITENIPSLPNFSNNLPKCIADEEGLNLACKLIQNSRKPLVIIGKGCQYARAENELLELIETSDLPFLPTPMGKGLVSDLHKNCVGPARSTALSQSDAILLVGGRLNWMLHFGQSPRFQENVKIIQIDVSPEEFNTNLRSEVNLWGDIKLTVKSLSNKLKSQQLNLTEWRSILRKKVDQNVKVSEGLMSDKSLPLTYYSAFNEIKKLLPEKFMYIGEGANTMDIGRTIIPQVYPRTKLDAGTYGTMGVGIPQAMAAKIVNPELPVFAIVGDSAFGFSAMELETAQRSKLPLIVIIINNNGIYSGVESISSDQTPLDIPPVALNPLNRYEKMAEMFGGKGIFAQTHEEVRNAVQEALAHKETMYIINVKISVSGQRKAQEHNWLTREAPKL